MVRIEFTSLKIFTILFLLVFQLFGFSNPVEETHARLLNVNKHWEHLSGYIQYTYRPQNEQELVQLHLMNVVAYLEQQPIIHLDHDQQKNRQSNISVLKKYTKAGVFPSNSVSRKRVPVFNAQRRVLLGGDTGQAGDLGLYSCLIGHQAG